MTIAITGSGLVSPLAASLAQLAEAIASGRVAAGQRAEGFEERAQVPPRRARRLSRLALMSLAAARGAMAEAGLTAGERTAVVLATGFGSLATTTQFMRGYRAGQAEPALFPTSVLNEPAAQLAIELGARGPNLTVLQHQASFHAAAFAAIDLLTLARADAVLLVGADEWSDELRDAWQRMGLLSPSGIARPLDRHRDGVVGGEAAVCFVLARADGLAIGPASGAVDYVALDASGAAADREAAARIDRNLPAGSMLAQTGEFPTSAAMRVAQAVVAIEHGLRAGTVGFSDPDPDALVPGLLRTAQKAPTRRVLVPSKDSAALLIHRDQL